MNRLFLFFFTVLIYSCATGPNKSQTTELAEKADSSIAESIPNGSTDQKLRSDTIILYENRINGIALPFGRKEMLAELKREFASLSVTKETGEQDGPDFPLYSVLDGTNEICFFALNSEDTLKLDQVLIKHESVKDQYGLKVGDGYQKIKKVRGTNTKTYTDLHQHTFAYFDNSNIIYEISGDAVLPDTVDFENLKLTEEQIKDWTIEYLIWRK